MSIQISKHARDRYIQRAVLQNNLVDDEGKPINIDRYGSIHHDRIEKEINKLFESCELIYTGAVKEHKSTRFFINKNGWCLVLAKDEELLVTVYKIDLELDDEAFNTAFIEKSIDLINKVSTEVQVEEEKFREDINELKSTKAMNEKRMNDLQTEINVIKGDNKIIEGKIESASGKAKLLQSKVYDAVTLLVSRDKGR